MVVFLLVSVAMFIVLLSISGPVDADHKDIMGDWEISGEVNRFSGETFDVKGNITILDGGVLKLYNCTLSVNWSMDGTRGLEVLATGRLEAHDTIIQGSDARIFVRLANDTLLERCTIKHFYGEMGLLSGITLTGGDITIKDTTIVDGSYYGLVPRTDVVLSNVTIKEIEYACLYVAHYDVTGPFSVNVTDCHFIGKGAGTHRYGVYLQTVQQGPMIDLVIRRSKVEDFETGIWTSNVENLDVLVEDCELVNNHEGAMLFIVEGSLTLRDNFIGHGSGLDSIGLTLMAGLDEKVILERNVVEDAYRGYVFSSTWTGPSVSWSNLTVGNCTEGIVATTLKDDNTYLSLYNSSVTDCTTDFVAEGLGNYRATIEVWDTVHTPGSGRVVGARSWICGYTVVDIDSVLWKDDGPIAEGSLVLEDEEDMAVTRFDLGALGPQYIEGWRVDARGMRMTYKLRPVIYISGWGFRGEEVEIWGVESMTVEIVDDFIPQVAITTPAPGAFLNITCTVVNGTYVEIGAGIAKIQAAMNGGQYVDIADLRYGKWSMELASLQDGLYNISVRGVDAVGNVGNASHVEFHIDTLPPSIVAGTPPCLVNTTSLTIRGTVEPGAFLAISGLECHVDDDGSFAAEVPLVEGRNLLRVIAVDTAGNTNSISFEVVRDTAPPALELLAPIEATWTNARHVSVEGLTEPGAEIRVNGHEIDNEDGSFHHVIDLIPGEVTIRVLARDSAGNRAFIIITQFVDWTAPGLTITLPEGGHLYTAMEHASMVGEVDDPTIEYVYVNDIRRPLTSGTFVMECELVEGTNKFNITITDAAGNSNSTVVIIVRDSDPPSYTVDIEPLKGVLITVGGDFYTTAAALEVHVVADEPVSIQVPGRSETPATLETDLRFDLLEGENRIAFTVSDRADHMAPAYLMDVIKDTQQPILLVLKPKPGTRTHEAKLLVQGRTDPGSNVTIDGVSVNLLPGGEFRQVVALKDGTNEINITSVDFMGNTNSTKILVLREEGISRIGAGHLVAIIGLLLVLAVIVISILHLTRRRRNQMWDERDPISSPEPETESDETDSTTTPGYMEIDHESPTSDRET